MIRPLQQDEALLDDISAASQDEALLHAWWLGQSGFLICWRGQFLLFDPYLSDSLTRKYASTDKPHVRMTERVIAPERLDFVDVITSTHNHTDHLDAETLLPLLKANLNVRLVLPEANVEFAAERLKREAGDPLFVGVNDGEEKDVAGFQFNGVPAAHEDLELDAQGRNLYMGFIVRAGPFTIYHSGDTLVYPGIVERLRAFQINLAFLPINGRAPERRVSGNLDGEEAAQLAHDAGIGCVVPCHYDMFEFNTSSPEPFDKACRRLGQPRRILQAGERMTLDA